MKYLIVLFAFFACTSPPVVEVKEPVVVPEVSASQYKADWNSEAWTKILVEALKESPLIALEVKDMKDFCGGDKIQAYVAILSSMARYESNFKPETKYKEGFSDKNGAPVISRGLLQISIESANGNYGCGFKSAEEIHDPAKHLPCVVKMANKLISKDGYITKNLGRYWSVMRAGHRNQKIDLIKKRSRELCK